LCHGGGDTATKGKPIDLALSDSDWRNEFWGWFNPPHPVWDKSALLPGQVVFFVVRKPHGPFDMETMAAKVRDGSVARGSLVWMPGMADWTAAENVPELQTLLASAPPLPPQG
jgi:hypothetical protein